MLVAYARLISADVIKHEKAKVGEYFRPENFHSTLSFLEFSAPFEMYLGGDKEALARGYELSEEVAQKLPNESAHHSPIHYVYIFYSAKTVANTRDELAPMIKYIGVGERGRFNDHIRAAEIKKKLGQEVCEIQKLHVELFCLLQLSEKEQVITAADTLLFFPFDHLLQLRGELYENALITAMREYKICSAFGN